MNTRHFFRLLFAALLFAAAAFLTAGRALALDVPPLAAPVNDYAGVLAPEVEARLNAELLALQQETGAQIAVLTIQSLEGEVLEDYSLRVASSWGLGKKGKDNGVLLLIAIKDRKLRIEVGQGLEGTLTDLLSGRIIREEIAPAFKLGDYAAGVANGISAMMRVVRSGEFAPSPQALAFTQRIKEQEDRNFYCGLGLTLANLVLGIGAALTKRREMLEAKSKKVLEEIENRHALPLCLAGAALAIAATVFFAYEPGDGLLGVALIAFCGLLWGPLLVYIPILAVSPSTSSSSTRSSSDDDDDSGYGSSRSSSGSSYSGGGGRFGGGGASGSW